MMSPLKWHKGTLVGLICLAGVVFFISNRDKNIDNQLESGGGYGAERTLKSERRFDGMAPHENGKTDMLIENGRHFHLSSHFAVCLYMYGMALAFWGARVSM